MRKSMWLVAAFLFSMFISGCGGGSSTSTVASATTALTPSDVANKTFYSTSTKGYIAFKIYSGSTGGPAAWDSAPNRNATPSLDVSGTWAITNGRLILSVAGTTAYQFTCIQKESNYWLMADGSNNITRFYFDNRLPDAEDYLNLIITPNGIRMGGAFQGTPLPTFSNVSTVVGITGQTATPFADYTSTSGRTPPVSFGTPISITMIDGKTLFVLDNISNRIHMVTLDANGAATNVKTLKSAANPTVDITFNNPRDITNDGKNLYVTDSSNFTIDKVALVFDSNNNATGTGTLSIVAGSTGSAGSIDGTGNITATTGTTWGTARFGGPIGITTDGTNLYVTDNEAIRKIDIGGSSSSAPQVTTLAGTLGAAGSADGTGTAARFNYPLRLTTDGTNLYVTDYNNYTIRKIVIATGAVTTIAGSAGAYGTNGTNPLTGKLARFNGPNGITTDGASLYVTDWGPVVSGNPPRGQVIFKIALTFTSDGFSTAVTRIAGVQDTIGLPTDPGLSSVDAALFRCPIGITTDGTSLFVADSLHYTIRRIFKE